MNVTQQRRKAVAARVVAQILAGLDPGAGDLPSTRAIARSVRNAVDEHEHKQRRAKRKAARRARKRNRR